MLVRVLAASSDTTRADSHDAESRSYAPRVNMPPSLMQNPAFSVNADQINQLAQRARSAVAAAPPRPLVILSGYRSPIFPALTAAALLRRFGVAPRDNTLCVSYFWARRVERAAEIARAAIEQRGWADQKLDVIGISMGGIVARTLAADHGLKVNRLFTLASPHRGAILARLITPDPAAKSLAPGSPLLTRLDTQLPSTIGELVCYALLRDWLVGAQQCAPPGHVPLWLDVDRWLARPLSHFSITSDRRILGDIALRIMGHAPWSSPGLPPPVQ